MESIGREREHADSRVEDFRKRGKEYAETCDRHLYRIRLSRELAVAHLQGQESRLPLDDELVAHSIGPATGDLVARIATMVTKTHFLLLKVEFEYFLNKLVRHAWECYYDVLVEGRHRALSEKYPLEGFARAIARNSGKDYIVGRIVPRHGLARLRNALKDVTRVDLADTLNKQDPRHWSQIHSAFEVRHLVEHANGKVDGRFLNEVSDNLLWTNSSWGDLGLTEGSKIEIRDNDFETTWAAMVAAVPTIWDSLRSFAPSSEHP